MFFTMANFQRLVISALVILTATFLFFAQSGEAAKGPKITSKVFISAFLCIATYLTPVNRSTLTSILAMNPLEGW